MRSFDGASGSHDRAPEGAASGGAPGKRTRTMALPASAVQRAAAPPAVTQLLAAAGPTSAPGDDPFGLHLLGAAPDVHAAAQHGISGPAAPLPHLDAIQASFGRHDVGGVSAHVGGPAAAATASMGAQAYATGAHVAFGDTPDLHTAAHEAAHVVQQRAGVHLKGGVGEVGDPYERAADDVADRVVRGESAEALLDTMAGPGTAAPAVQHRKGDFASLRKPTTPKTFLVDLGKGPQQAAIVKLGDEEVLLDVEGQEVQLAKLDVEGDSFALLDRAVKLDVGAEKELGKAKSQELEQTFVDLVGKYSQTPVEKSHVQIALAAHDPGGTAAQFALAQHTYQLMLRDTFGLTLAQIMDHHRSAGFEYEFGRFYDPKRPQIETEPELLRSHVTLATSAPFSPFFGGRAAVFRLETDSRNCLELVTPPFLSLVCGGTAGVLGGIHALYSTTALDLGKELQQARAAKEESSGSNEEQPKKSLFEEDVGVPISAQLGLFTKMICDGDWKWEANDELAQSFCFSFKGAKHGSKAYGQVNVSMTPEEILETARQLPQWNEEQDSIGLKRAKTIPVPTQLAENIFGAMWDKVETKEDTRLEGAVRLFARSASNIVAMPSIMYRRQSDTRPEDGNLATEIKETLLLWVKDFPHAVIADALCDTESAKAFCIALESTAGPAWSFIAEQLAGNVDLLKRETTKKVELYASPDYYMPIVTQAEKTERVKLLSQYKTKKHPSQLALMAGLDAALAALQTAEEEFQRMVKLHLASVMGKPYVKRHTKEENDEQFGDGYGVRKDTYLDRTPGKRRLRVAEIRDTSHLPRLEKTL